MDDADVAQLGMAVGTYLRRRGKQHLTVGRDCRLTSEAYARRLIEGLTATGCHVTDIGVCATPVGYFSIRHLEKEGNIMVTASHNPPEYNGFKITSGMDSVHGRQIQEIYEIVKAGDYEKGVGDVETVEILKPYQAYIRNNIHLSRPLKVGIDAGNGTAGISALPILKDLGCEVHDLYCDMDGTFPNHEADPTVAENMRELIDLVTAEKLDIGFGYDGDGDRIGVVDNRGQLIYGDRLMIIFAREILSRKPGATFIGEVKCSQTLYDDIEKHGGRAIMWKTGHSLIKHKMKAEQAALAGEMSGHIFFADRWYGFDDAIYSTARVLDILARSDRPLSQMLSDLPVTQTTPEIRIYSSDEVKFRIVDGVKQELAKRYPVIDIDGVRALYPYGWALVRASNTQGSLVLRFEADTPENLAAMRKEVSGIIEAVIQALDEGNTS